MKVKDLIEELKKCDQDFPVYFDIKDFRIPLSLGEK